jgi:hypothetical protein
VTPWSSGSQDQLSFDSANFTVNGMFYVADGDLSATTAGLYEIDAGVDWQQNGAGSRFLGINVNGNCCFAGSWVRAVGDGDTVQSASDLLDLKKGAEVRVTLNQTSGGWLNVEPSQGTFLAMHWVSQG